MSKKNISIMIVEDNAIVADYLSTKVSDFGYKVLPVSFNVEEARENSDRYEPDILLMDIELGDKEKDGIDLAEEISGSYKLPVIFISSYNYNHYLERTHDMPKSYYLVKPVSEEQLEATLNLAVSDLTKKDEDIVKGSKTEKAVFLKHKGRYRKIEKDQIYFLKASGVHTEVFWLHEVFEIQLNIKKFLLKVNEPNLIRTHRSYAVNVKKITGFDDSKAYLDYFGKEVSIPISRTFRQDFIDAVKLLKTY